jgi:hypothetical protein
MSQLVDMDGSKKVILMFKTFFLKIKYNLKKCINSLCGHAISTVP